MKQEQTPGAMVINWKNCDVTPPRQHFFSLRVTDMRNKLPADIVDAPNTNALTNSLDKAMPRFMFWLEVPPTSQIGEYSAAA